MYLRDPPPHTRTLHTDVLQTARVDSAECRGHDSRLVVDCQIGGKVYKGLAPQGPDGVCRPDEMRVLNGSKAGCVLMPEGLLKGGLVDGGVS